jgi:hypothetical protein
MLAGSWAGHLVDLLVALMAAYWADQLAEKKAVVTAG